MFWNKKKRTALEIELETSRNEWMSSYQILSRSYTELKEKILPNCNKCKWLYVNRGQEEVLINGICTAIGFTETIRVHDTHKCKVLYEVREESNEG